MTGSLQTKTMRSGKTYYYIVLDTKPVSKWISTGLLVKGNKRAATQMLNEVLASYEREPKAEDAMPKASQDCFIPENNASILFCDWVEKWLENRSIDVRNSTSDSYRLHSRQIISYFREKQTKLAEITYSDIEEYCSRMLSEGKVNRYTGEKTGYAIRTVRSQKFIIVSALNWAVVHGLIASNPAADIKVSRKKNKQLARKPVFFTVQEANDYLTFLKKNDDPLYDLIYATLMYGLRRSEVLGLTIQAVDFKERKLHINRTVVKIIDLHDEEDTKTFDSERDYPLTDEMVNFFRSVLVKKKENQLFYRNDYVHSDFLFTWEDGHAFSPDYVSRHHKKMVGQFGKPNLTFHNLRHSTACILYEQGWPAKDIQEWLGHADIYTTMNIYTHIDRAHRERQADSLTGILTHSSAKPKTKKLDIFKAG